MKNRAVLVPTYMSKFACIGSECEDTCCHGWQVTIDKATYKKYDKLKDRELSPIMKRVLKKNRDHTSNSDYAYIQLEQGGCPFLSEEKLCSIQAKHGANLLSHTCMTFPRVENLVNNVLERSLTVSCPEAARLVLLDPQGIVFTEISEPQLVNQKATRTIDTNRDNESIEKLFWELRIFTIQVLQNRQYSLADRLVILGLFYKKVQTMIEEKKIGDLMETIAIYLNAVETGSISAALPTTSKTIEIQVKLLKQMFDIRIQMGIASSRYLQCYEQFLKGLGYLSNEVSDERIAARYQEVYEKFYEPFMKKHEYILENYLVNTVFRNAFPLENTQKTVYQSFVRLATQYSLVKMHLVGMAGHFEETFGTVQVVQLIQSFSKVVEHNTQYLDLMINSLEENGYDSLAYLTILIRN